MPSARLRDNGTAAVLHIAGRDDVGGYHRHLSELIATLGLQGQVKLLGSVSEDVVRAELEAAHVFVLSSIAEPLGVVIMEAMAMQLVVVTNAGGVGELVRNGSNGLTVPPRNPTALAEAVGGLLNDPALAVRLGCAGRRTVEARFSSSRSAGVPLDCLERRPVTPAVASPGGVT